MRFLPEAIVRIAALAGAEDPGGVPRRWWPTATRTRRGCGRTRGSGSRSVSGAGCSTGAGSAYCCCGATTCRPGCPARSAGRSRPSTTRAATTSRSRRRCASSWRRTAIRYLPVLFEDLIVTPEREVARLASFLEHRHHHGASALDLRWRAVPPAQVAQGHGRGRPDLPQELPRAAALSTRRRRSVAASAMNAPGQAEARSGPGASWRAARPG